MHDATARVRQQHEDEQEAARRGRHHEEIRRDDLSHVMSQECGPRL